ncbi:LruC domain-containing protein [bacterium]|nr:LruC domain-containing protein [bacterium]
MFNQNLTKICLLGITVLSLVACGNDDEKTEVVPPVPVEELSISNTFNWSTTQKVSVNIDVNYSSETQGFYIVYVYDENPYGKGNLLSSGSAREDIPFTTKITVPSYLDELYVLKRSPKGASELTKIKITDGTISHTFNETSSAPVPNGKYENEINAGPDCSTGCTTTYVNKNGITVSNGTVCVTGNMTGNIEVKNNGTLRICGTANVGSITLQQNGVLIVTETATFTGNNFNINSSSAKLTNYSDNFNLTTTFSFNGMVENNGKMNVAGNFVVNSQGSLVNNGEIDATGSIDNNSTTTNNFKMHAGNNFTNNGQAVFYNNCQLIADDNFHQNSDFYNYGFASAGLTMYFTGSGNKVTQTSNGAMFKTADLIVNGDAEGLGSTSSIVATGTTNINGGGSLSGTIELCASNLQNNNGSINAPASLSCNNFIPTSACNPIGTGTPVPTDTDGDGVSDNDDEYPNDPAKAFNVYYPGENVYSTLAYEDKWPDLGDYDFNDLVIENNWHGVMNATNQLVDGEIKIKVRAIGANYRNGFGFVWNLDPNRVASFTGSQITENYINLLPNGLEAGQSKTVMIVFDNASALMPRPNGADFVNTVPGETTVTPYEMTLNFTFITPLTQAELDNIEAPFNPFLIVNRERGKEVHLPDQAPTDLANLSLLGTSADNSNPGIGRYYKTTDNLPWAIEIPVSFSYVIEKEQVVNGHLHFGDWAQSSGTIYTDWYLDLPGYRNTDFIYTP